MSQALPTKKQQILLQFIDGFIKGNGYGPSYREIARALGYKSVSTVAVHVDALIAKGYLQKSDGYSVRSLLVTTPHTPQAKTATHRLLMEREQQYRKAGDSDAADCLARAQQLLDAEPPQTV